MNPIKFECPHCHEIIAGDESLYGQQVVCRKCQATILVPPAPASPEPQTARLIQEPAAAVPLVPGAANQETDIFTLSPVARAYPGQILLGVIFIGLAVGLAIRAQAYKWPPWVALVPLVLGLLLLLLVWIRVKSCSYRLTTQRLFVRRGWLAKHVNELELYRVKDVVVDQGGLQRLLGYGTITVVSEDATTPEVHLVKISRPTTIKELIRTQYRAARQREGVHPTEFMQSPGIKVNPQT
jgi:membrane protein YdbS with pleckstrin-like domain